MSRNIDHLDERTSTIHLTLQGKGGVGKSLVASLRPKTASHNGAGTLRCWAKAVHTFASWYMMNGGDLYELAKILGHSNIKMTERYAKLARQHIARTGSTAREIWKLMEVSIADKTNAS
jgi:site-specific recombinase XerC